MFLFIQHEAEASLNLHLLIMCLRFEHRNTLRLELFGGFLAFQWIFTLSRLSFSHFKQLSEGCSRRVHWWSAPINLWCVPSVFSEGHFLRVFFLHIFNILKDLFKSFNTSLWVSEAWSLPNNFAPSLFSSDVFPAVLSVLILMCYFPKVTGG